MAMPIVFFDIAGSDDVKLVDFYSSVFDWQDNSLYPLHRPSTARYAKIRRRNEFI